MAAPRLGGLAARVALALALVAALVAVSVAEDAEAFTVDGIDYEVTDEGSHQVKITSYSGSPKHVYGTVSFGGAEWTVVSVGDCAFNSSESLTTADLPSATYVGYGAFSDCGFLTTADLPSATYVGEDAFSGCRYLTTVDLRSATYVGEAAFSGCGSLTTADLPSATSVGDHAFSGCDALTFARFSDELESVGSFAFKVYFYSGSDQLSADAGSLKGRTPLPRA